MEVETLGQRDEVVVDLLQLVEGEGMNAAVVVVEPDFEKEEMQRIDYYYQEVVEDVAVGLLEAVAS